MVFVNRCWELGDISLELLEMDEELSDRGVACFFDDGLKWCVEFRWENF